MFWGSFVTYTDDAKQRMLGIPGKLVEEHGAVSRAVALAMAECALEKSGVSWAFSITGLAGPTGDLRSPVGTVWIALADGKDSRAEEFHFSGSRNEVREAAAVAALEILLEGIGDIDKKNDLGYNE